MENNESKLLRVEIRCKTITKDDGTSFLAFKGYSKKGWMDLRFTKECKNVPNETCIIFVKSENLNVNMTSKFPTIWVKNVESIERYAQNQNVSDYFD